MNNTCIQCPQFFDWYSIGEKVYFMPMYKSVEWCIFLWASGLSISTIGIGYYLFSTKSNDNKCYVHVSLCFIYIYIYIYIYILGCLVLSLMITNVFKVPRQCWLLSEQNVNHVTITVLFYNFPDLLIVRQKTSFPSICRNLQVIYVVVMSNLY